MSDSFYGEAMEAMGSYLSTVLGYKLAMGWLWAGYGEAIRFFSWFILFVSLVFSLLLCF